VVSERAFVLRLSNVRIQRAGTVIVEDVSWTIESGQHWIVLGANGSGKTSLLSAILGYLPATLGDIEVLGERYGEGDWREMRRRIGIVSTALAPMLEGDEPVLKTIISGKSAMLGYWGPVVDDDVELARRILEQIECAHLGARPWRVLSQGERQRVLIGRAIMARPPLVILDEPCAGLDPAAREHFLQFLERWGRSSGAPSLVLVTHHVEEVMPVFSHVLVLLAGRVLSSGAKEEVLTAEILSTAFGSQVRLVHALGRYSLHIEAKNGVIL
jgi:iron complex transport system ATP-binding protein